MAKASQIDVRVDHEGWAAALGGAPDRFVRRILRACAAAEETRGDVSVALSDDETVSGLNQQWRDKPTPTNVLSFPAPEGEETLGDIILALETIESEARAQQKSVSAHAAHLLTHGFLHLLGYDHEAEDEAEEMEQRERAILAGLGFDDPYAEHSEAAS